MPILLLNKILLVEDDERLAKVIQHYLSQHHFDVQYCVTGSGVSDFLRNFAPDLIILDLMLPDMSGLDICRALRPHFHGPILMLTANDSEIEEIVGLELGADDYLIKPIEPRLLLARIRSALRVHQHAPLTPTINHNNPPQEHVLHIDHLLLDTNEKMATLHNNDLALTGAEFDLLWLLASHAGQILSRDDIQTALRNIEFDGLDRAIDTRISKIRRKLGDNPDAPYWIRTIRGQGYVFRKG